MLLGDLVAVFRTTWILKGVLTTLVLSNYKVSLMIVGTISRLLLGFLSRWVSRNGASLT